MPAQNPLDALVSTSSPEQTPAKIPSGSSNPLDSLFSGGGTPAPAPIQAPSSNPLEAAFGVSSSPLSGQPTPPTGPAQHLYQDSTQPLYKRAWDWANNPLLTANTFGLPEDLGMGGFGRGVEHIVSGLTSPLSIALTAATFGTGGILESAGATALKEATTEAGARLFTDAEIPQIMKASQIAIDTAKAMPAGETAVADAVKEAGVDPALWKRGQTFLYDNHLSEHDLLGGNLLERGAFQILRKTIPDIPIAATIKMAKTANSLLNAGFTYQMLESASAMSPRFLDALKEGDYDKAAEYGTEALASGTLGILGASHALHSAGELFKPLLETDAVRPSDEWVAIQRANNEREAQHAVAEQEAISLSNKAKDILGHKPARPIIGDSPEVKAQKALELASVQFHVLEGGDASRAATDHDILAEAAGRDERVTPNLGQLIPQDQIPARANTEVVHSNDAGEVRVGADGRPVVWLAPNAWYSFNSAVEPESPITGVSYSPEEASYASYRLQKAGSNPAIQELFDTAQAMSKQSLLTTAASPRVTGEGAIKIVSEELHHTAQRELSRDGDILNHLDGAVVHPNGNITVEPGSQFDRLHGILPPEWVADMDRRGYDSNPVTRVVETAAQFLSGRAAEKVSVGDQAKWLKEYFKEVEAKHGPEALKTLENINDVARQHVEDINAQRESASRAAEQAASAGGVRGVQEGRGRPGEVATSKPESTGGLKATAPVLEEAQDAPDIRRVFHWSRKPAFTETNPELAGTGVRGAERNRPSIPGTYFGESEYREPMVTGNATKYHADLDYNKVYDRTHDPLDLVPQARELARKNGDPIEFNLEKLIQKNGYEGYRAQNVVKYFKPVKVMPEYITERPTTDANKFYQAITGVQKAYEESPRKSLRGRDKMLTTYTPDEYKHMRLFMSPDGKTGFALKGDEIVSGFSHPTDTNRSAEPYLDVAVRNGGRRLDAYDTLLPDIYAAHGFRAVARMPWNDEYAPQGWDYNAFKEFNGGRPDVVFMVYDPANAGRYSPEDGVKVDSYEEAEKVERQALKQADEAPRPFFGQTKPMGLAARDWDHVKKYLTPEEVDKHNTDEKKNSLVAAFNILPDHEEWSDAVKAGRAGQMWYERSSRAFDALMDSGFDRLHPEDKDKFLNFVAALSPVQSVRSNLSMALEQWSKWDKAGRPTDVVWKDGQPNKSSKLYQMMRKGVDLKSRLNNAIKALQGESLSGPKVSAFTKNLGEDVNRVTNDTWMAVLGGTDPGRVNKPATYDAMSAKIREAAEANEMNPRQAQAAAWSFIKSLAELSGWGKDRWIPPQEIVKQGLLTPELVAKHSADFADLLQNDPQIRGLISKLGGDINAFDEKLKSYVPERPAQGEAPELSDRLLNAAGRLEAARSNAAIQRHLEAKSGPQGNFDFDATDFNPSYGEAYAGGGTGVGAKYMPMYAREVAPQEAADAYDALQKKIEDRDTELDAERAKGVKYYFPENQNLLKATRYAGPEVSAEKVRSLSQDYSQDSYAIQQARDVYKAMQAGQSFKEAMQENGSIALAEHFGGKLDHDGPIPPEYKPYPKDLLDLYDQRDKIGEDQLKKSTAEISGRLEKAGLSQDEIKHVMEKYALNPDKHDVFAQHMAAEHTQGLVDQDLKHQLGNIYSILAIHRDIPVDDEHDFFRNPKATEDSKKALRAIVSYFHPELENRPLLGRGNPLFARPNNGQLPPNIDDMIQNNKFKDMPKEYQDLVLNSLRRVATGALSEKEQSAAKFLRDEQDRNFEIGSQNDLLHNHIDDYMTRVYQDTNPLGKVISADAKSGKFATQVSMAKHRVYDSNLTALLKSPKQMLLDPVDITAQGRAQLIKAAANKRLIDNLRDKFTRASDGRPAVVLSGQGQVVSGQNGEDPRMYIDDDRVRKININSKVVDQLTKSGDLQRYLDDGTIKDITPYVRPNNIGAAIDRLEEQSQRKEAQYDEVGNNKLRTDLMYLKSMQGNGDFSGLREFNDKLEKQYAWDPQDYISLDHSAMKGWNFVTNSSDGTPVYVRSDIKAHPEFAQYLKDRLGLEPSAISKNPIGKAALGLGTKLKHTLLSMSPFHMVQIALRGVMTGVNPFTLNAPDILDGAKVDPADPNSPTKMYKMVEHGLTTGTDYKSLQEHSEGVSSGGGALRLIPGVGKPIANALDWYQDFLFKRYIPAIKASAAEHMFDEYQRLHPEWSTDRVARVAGAHANDSFGGINWRAMGRSATTQDWGRLMLLAPDWLESEMRSGARLFNKDEGGIGRAQVAKMALGLWGIARVLNYLTTGNGHYEAPFGLAVKNKEGKETVFGIRTLPTDLLHAASDPVGFIKGRLSPTIRTGEELLTQRDTFGRKLGPQDLWADVFHQMAPIPAQSIGQAITGTGPEVGNVGQVWKAVGGTAQNYLTPAQKMAADLASSHTEDGPIDPAQMARHRRVMQLEDQARSGEVSWPDLMKLTYQTDQLSEQELKKIQNNVKHTQGMSPDMASLYTRAARLPAKEYVDLLDTMNPAEKTALTPLTLQVQKRYLNKAKKELTPDERAKDPVFQRFVRMIPGQQQQAPQPQSQAAPAPVIPPAVQKEVAYLYHATHPVTGHKIGSVDGQNWQDKQTGEPVNG